MKKKVKIWLCTRNRENVQVELDPETEGIVVMDDGTVYVQKATDADKAPKGWSWLYREHYKMSKKKNENNKRY